MKKFLFYASSNLHQCSCNSNVLKRHSTVHITCRMCCNLAGGPSDLCQHDCTHNNTQAKPKVRQKSNIMHHGINNVREAPVISK